MFQHISCMDACIMRVSCMIHAHVYHSTMDEASVHEARMVLPSCIMHSVACMPSWFMHVLWMKNVPISHMFHAWNMKHACTLYAGHAWNMHGESRMKLAVACMKHACLCSLSSRVVTSWVFFPGAYIESFSSTLSVACNIKKRWIHHNATANQEWVYPYKMRS